MSKYIGSFTESDTKNNVPVMGTYRLRVSVPYVVQLGFFRNTCRDVVREKRSLYRGVAPARAVDYGTVLWYLYFLIISKGTTRLR